MATRVPYSPLPRPFLNSDTKNKTKQTTTNKQTSKQQTNTHTNKRTKKQEKQKATGASTLKPHPQTVLAYEQTGSLHGASIEVWQRKHPLLNYRPMPNPVCRMAMGTCLLCANRIHLLPLGQGLSHVCLSVGPDQPYL